MYKGLLPFGIRQPVNKNISILFFVSLDVIQIKIFDIVKVVCTIFYINLYYPNHLYTNMIIGIST